MNNEPYTVEDQSRNGVKVIVRTYLSGTVVEADCSCFGSSMRAHNTEQCPNRLRIIAEEKMYDPDVEPGGTVMIQFYR